ncbi:MULTISPECIES: hypothetical protein [Streptomyces]|uniref:hypothetical protein n=1 Tax=Streptomyces TaxID=1883 RepID=UPI00068E198C|nr:MULTISPECIES: hypothetical protein [unclassified Streptomyces]KOX45199.1 hypothetical protein ADL09_23590 [Streptomyces sp. NRRL F-7442]
MTVSPPLDVSALRHPLGSVLLYAPTDWFDLLADGDDEEAARTRCSDLINRSYSHKAAGSRQAYTDALMAWRRVLLAQGVITHGVVAVPEGEYGRAVWQISAGVVEVATVNQDVDLGEVLARHFGQELRGRQVYTESFPTEMGIGMGIISQPELFSADRTELFPEPATAGAARPLAKLGLAVCLACPPGGGRGLMVVGTCLDAEQVLSMASIVALIAGKSIFLEQKDPVEDGASS